jgi:hypothetical protein
LQSRVFLEIDKFWLVLSSHDCQVASGTVPQGLLSRDALGALAIVNHVCHTTNFSNKAYLSAFVKRKWGVFGFDARTPRGYKREGFPPTGPAASFFKRCGPAEMTRKRH